MKTSSKVCHMDMCTFFFFFTEPLTIFSLSTVQNSPLIRNLLRNRRRFLGRIFTIQTCFVSKQQFFVKSNCCFQFDNETQLFMKLYLALFQEKTDPIQFINSIIIQSSKLCFQQETTPARTVLTAETPGVCKRPEVKYALFNGSIFKPSSRSMHLHRHKTTLRKRTIS